MFERRKVPLPEFLLLKAISEKRSFKISVQHSLGYLSLWKAL